jgi:molybdopterin molybdotransferase
MPILGKSGLIRTMSEADGYIILDVNDEGINKGEEVEVYLL